MTITGGDMQYTGLSLAEARAGVLYPVEPAPGEPGSGTPLYVVGDILGNTSTPTKGAVVASVRTGSGEPASYGTFDVVKNGNRWEIQKYWHENFQVDALQVFNLNLHRIDHVDPHFVIITDQTITSGGQSYFRLSLGEILGGTPPVPQEQIVLVLPSGNSPRDLNHDGLYEDLNGNGHLDFNDVVLFFNNMEWIADNEPVSAFDFNRNGRIDFNDIVVLFNEL